MTFPTRAVYFITHPDVLVDPAVHGALLSAVADGAPLDRLGQHRLESLKAAGLATADGRPRFPVAAAPQAKAVAETAGDLGRAMARLVAGEWSRLEVEYEPVHAALSPPTPAVADEDEPGQAATAGAAPGAAAFLVVGGLLLGSFGPFPFDSAVEGLKIGLVVAIAAPLGDLSESLIKRDLGIKDMGTLLPGHGGVLDRFDALIFVLPAIWYLARVSDFFLN